DRLERQDVVRAYREPYQRPAQTWQPQPEVYETLSRILADGRANAATFEKVCREGGFPGAAVKEAAALFKGGTVASSASSASVATEEGEDWGWEPKDTAAEPAQPPTTQGVSNALYRLLEGDEHLARLRNACENGALSLEQLQHFVFSEDPKRTGLDRRLLSLVS